MRETNNLRPFIRLIRPKVTSKIIIVPWSVAAHRGNDSIYGKRGMISLMLAENFGNDSRYYHHVSWASHKHKRMSISSFRAEYLAAANANYRGFDLNISFRSKLKFTFDKNVLF